MERLFFTLLNDKKFTRQIKLLKYLDHQRTIVSVEELANELDCTKPTLRNDINDLQLFLPDDIKIIDHFRIGYELLCPSNKTVDFYLTKFAKETIVYQIIDAILQNRIYTFQKALDQFYVTKSTLQKIIQHMNRILKFYSIRLRTSVLDFDGDESNIRYFLFSFYYDFRDCFIVDLSSNLHIQTFKNLTKASYGVNWRPLHLSFYRSVIWMSIIHKRQQASKFVTVDKEVLEEIIHRPDFEDYKELLLRVGNKTFNIPEVSMDEIVWAYISRLHCISYMSTSMSFESDGPCVYRRDDSQENIDKVNECLKLMFEGADVTTMEYEKIRSYLLNLRLLMKLTPLFACVTNSLKQFIKETNHPLYDKWSLFLQENCKEKMFPKKYLEDIAITLAMLHSSIVAQQQTKIIHIFFSFQAEAGYDELLIQATKTILNKNCIPHFFSKIPITNKIIDELKPSLIVSNYDLTYLKNVPCMVYRLSYLPNASEWIALKNTIYQLVK